MSSKKFPSDEPDIGRVNVEINPLSLLKYVTFIPKLIEQHLYTYNALQKQQIEVLLKAFQATCKTPIRAGNPEEPSPYFFQNSDSYDTSGEFLPKFYTDKRRVNVDVSSYAYKNKFVDSIIKAICIFQSRRLEKPNILSVIFKHLQRRAEFEYDPIHLFCEEFKTWAVEFDSVLSSNEQARHILAERIQYIDYILNYADLFENTSQTLSFVSLLSQLKEECHAQLPRHKLSIQEGLENIINDTNTIVENSVEFLFFFNLCTKKKPPKIFIARDLLSFQSYAEHLDNSRGLLLKHCFKSACLGNLLSSNSDSERIVDEITTLRRTIRALGKKSVTSYPISLDGKVQLLDNWWVKTFRNTPGVFTPFCTKEYVDAYLDVIATVINVSLAFKTIKYFQHSPSHLKEVILSLKNCDVFLMTFAEQVQKLIQKLTFLKKLSQEVNEQLDVSTMDIFAKNWRKGLTSISGSVDNISAAFNAMKPSLILMKEVSEAKRAQQAHLNDEQGVLGSLQKTIDEYVKYHPINPNRQALTYNLPALQAPVQFGSPSQGVRSLIIATGAPSTEFSYREIVGVVGVGVCLDLCLDGAFALSSSLLCSSAVALIYLFREPIGNFATLAYSSYTQSNKESRNNNLVFNKNNKKEQLAYWEVKLSNLKKGHKKNDIIALRHVCMLAGLLTKSPTIGARAKKILDDNLSEYIHRSKEDVNISAEQYLTLRLTVVQFFIKKRKYTVAINACNDILNYSNSNGVLHYQKYHELAKRQLKYIEEKEKTFSEMVPEGNNIN